MPNGAYGGDGLFRLAMRGPRAESTSDGADPIPG